MTPAETLAEIRAAVADYGQQDGVTVDQCDLALDALNSGHRIGPTLAKSVIIAWRKGQAEAAEADSDLLPVVAELDDALAQLEVKPMDVAPDILPATPSILPAMPPTLNAGKQYLYVDVETLPTADQAAIDRIAAGVRPPGSMKKADTIERWMAEEKAGAVEEAVKKTALNGLYGQLGAIAWAFGGRDVEALATARVDAAEKLTEAKLLRSFVSAVDDFASSSLDRIVIVGHNVEFDLRFVTQRAIVLGVRLPRCWPAEIKPWGRDMFCTMTTWAGAKGYVGLHELDLACGGEGKVGVDGSMVADMVAAGRGREVVEYCRGDVRRARRIHRMMMFAFGEISVDPHFDEMEI